jgi:hypothetical protein
MKSTGIFSLASPDKYFIRSIFISMADARQYAELEIQNLLKLCGNGLSPGAITGIYCPLRVGTHEG